MDSKSASEALVLRPAKQSRHWLGYRHIGLAILLTLLIFWETFRDIAEETGLDLWIGEPAGDHGLLDATIDDLSLGLTSNSFTSEDLVQAYIARIHETQSTFNAVVEINSDALSIAAQLDDERKMGISRGPLHGIPILLKDNIATNDKMNNTAGSYALLGARVPHDSTVVTKLRRAGAIILGKVNLSQWASVRSMNGSSGWSAYGGQTYAAYYPRQDPGGSSSGSGVASSLGLATACLGTETAGSIIFPSSHNNIVGIKPSVGLTSRYLVVPISEHQDTVGPMTRTVKDGAYILQAIAGSDLKDNYTSTIPFEKLPDYVAACKLSGLEGKRIGVPRNAIRTTDTSHPVLKAFNAALKTLSDAGAIIVDNTNYTCFDEPKLINTTRDVVGADFLTNIASFFSQLSLNPSGVTDLISLRDFTLSNSLEGFPEHDIGAWEYILAFCKNNTSLDVWKEREFNTRLLTSGGVEGALRNHSLDALVVPSAFGVEGYDLSATQGLPIVTVPLGAYPNGTKVEYDEGLVTVAPNVPFGLSFLGGRFSEEVLIGLAYAFEQRTMAREKIKPYMVPSTELRDAIDARKRPL